MTIAALIMGIKPSQQASQNFDVDSTLKMPAWYTINACRNENKNTHQRSVQVYTQETRLTLERGIKNEVQSV